LRTISYRELRLWTTYCTGALNTVSTVAHQARPTTSSACPSSTSSASRSPRPGFPPHLGKIPKMKPPPHPDLPPPTPLPCTLRIPTCRGPTPPPTQVWIRERIRKTREQLWEISLVLTGHVLNPPALKIHPIKLENCLLIEVKG